MITVNLKLPPDATFLSSILYEGILYATAQYSVTYDYKTIKFNAYFLKQAFKDLHSEEYNNIRIGLAGKNDNINETLFKKFSIDAASRKTLSEIFAKLNENFSLLSVDKDVIELQQLDRKGNILIDASDEKDGLSLQLLKIDRYTGLSSLETKYTTKQLTLYLSKEALLIALLGIFSSYVCTVGDEIYFLSYSPEQVLELLSKSDKTLLTTYTNIKADVKRNLKEILEKIYLNELIFLELLLNLEIANKMRKSNLNKFSTILFKIKREGPTYKIYEVIPITVFDKIVFNEKIRDYFRDRIDSFIEAVRSFLTNSSVLNSLASLNKGKKRDEADNILKAVQSLYKFIIVGDGWGLYNFVRELWAASEKAEKDHNSRKAYLQLIKRIPY
ncbi:MAG: hypothetical protein OdinLCB4_007470 [Candidatus Odinarchaeum yellowstonii]|uniref:Uncharacterized protein n=1 Tax=Odinarchaeota yellowstonii (strain LCB_4) TaxID=1841599 RepID=A0AAF0IAY5_ODILC|nr:MAG: hypothetical protein OdinLCB4_007470 [Candidatus Odinarchaeum yellowstonii]